MFTGVTMALISKCGILKQVVNHHNRISDLSSGMSCVVGDVAKLQNHSGCWGSTNAVALCGLWVVAAGYNLDSGQGYLTGTCLLYLLTACRACSQTF